MVSLLAYSNKIYDLILIAPVTKARKEFPEKKWQTQFQKKGYMLYKKDGRTFKIPQKYIEELAHISQLEILTKVECPTLIIWGDLDTSIALDELEAAISLLPLGSSLKIIKGANHKFDNKEEELADIIVEWVSGRNRL